MRVFLASLSIVAGCGVPGLPPADRVEPVASAPEGDRPPRYVTESARAGIFGRGPDEVPPQVEEVVIDRFEAHVSLRGDGRVVVRDAGGERRGVIAQVEARRIILRLGSLGSGLDGDPEIIPCEHHVTDTASETISVRHDGRLLRFEACNVGAFSRARRVVDAALERMVATPQCLDVPPIKSSP